MSKISLIIEREYLTRVQKKSFILMTILSPIVMVALIFAPIWLAQLSSDEVRQIAIIDQTGLYKNIYENSEEYQFTYTQGILNPAEMRAEESQPYAYVIIKDNLLNNPKGMTIYSQKQITNSCESMITSQMEEFLKNEKLLSYNIPNIKQIIDDSDINLHVDTIRLEEDGAETQTSSEMVMVIGMAMTLIIYMFLMLYGGQVMSSVMQEKTNRIVEVMVSSVKPFELMIGKITSIGLVGLTQLGIWILFIIGISMRMPLTRTQPSWLLFPRSTRLALRVSSKRTPLAARSAVWQSVLTRTLDRSLIDEQNPCTGTPVRGFLFFIFRDGKVSLRAFGAGLVFSFGQVACAPRGPEAELVFSLSCSSRWWRGAGFFFWSSGFALRAGQR